jgi:hypothetical protein
VEKAMKSTINRNGPHSNRPSTWLTSVVAIAMSATLQQVVVQAAPIRAVAFIGQQAPGMPAGATFTSIGRTFLNDTGQTAFLANVGDIEGIWSESSGRLELVAAVGSPAPGTPGLAFSRLCPWFKFIELNSAGEIAFEADLTHINDRGVWAGGPGSLRLVARQGDHAPGTPDGVTYTSPSLVPPVLNDAGQTAFVAYLTGPGVDSANASGIWSQGSGSLALIARSGSQAPGTPSGVTFDYFASLPRLNNNGQTAFLASLSGGGVDNTDNRGIWSERLGSLALVARSGYQAPGTPSGVNFLGFDPAIALNDAAQTAFQADLTGSGVNDANNAGIWSEGSGSLALVARSGSEAPGTPGGTLFREFPDFPLKLNSAGQMAFLARLTGSGVDATNDYGIWLESSGTLALIAREGEHAPGTPNGVTFASDLGAESAIFYRPGLNNAGQVAFQASLSGLGVDSSNDFGIWATDPAGVLQLVARKGESLELAPGDFRTVQGFYLLANNVMGNSDGFNNLGQIAFSASFTDGSSGIFVSNAVAIPEPASLILSLTSGGALAFVFRRLGRRSLT